MLYAAVMIGALRVNEEPRCKILPHLQLTEKILVIAFMATEVYIFL